MATILFTWEIGEASGHIAPYINLIKLLESQGHRVFFAAKSMANMHRLLKETHAQFIQAPTLQAKSQDCLFPVDSYAKILNNTGYARVDELCGLIKAWQTLYDLCKPDICLYDYSPTAILASQNYRFKRIQIGTSFFSPPNIQPLPGLAQLQGLQQDVNALIHFEIQLIEKINTALAQCQLQPIKNLFDLQQCDERIFLSFKEFEHYPQRADAKFLGIFRSPRGSMPEWPAGPKRIFAYLKPSKGLDALFTGINERGYATLIYPDNISESIQRKYSSPNLQFVKKPLDMRTVCETADLAICNANHGTLGELLLGGVPVLSLPLHAEQNICAINTIKIGVGLSAPKLHGPSIVKKMDVLLHDQRFKQSALAFAKKYADFDKHDINQEVAAIINQQLSH